MLILRNAGAQVTEDLGRTCTVSARVNENIGFSTIIYNPFPFDLGVGSSQLGDRRLISSVLQCLAIHFYGNTTTLAMYQNQTPSTE